MGEDLDQIFRELNLAERIGAAELPMMEGLLHDGAQRRQDHAAVGFPAEVVLDSVRVRGWVGGAEADSVASMVLRLVARMIDKGFQDAIHQAAEANNGFSKSAEPKRHARMMNKAMSPVDHRYQPAPRPMLNIDIVRGALVFDTVEDLLSTHRGLQDALGIPFRVKNMFAFDQARAKDQFHYRALMVNWLYDANCTFGELVQRPENSELLDQFLEAAPENPNSPWERWRRQAHLAAEILRSERVAHLPVRMVCETQSMLKGYFEGRVKMHLLYKVCRASTDSQLHQDFLPNPTEPRT
uniref:Uncharacterized protein n=1 Tax=Rhizochromulina marina TaxID=1034831 RepID=A0A6U1BTK5_9STRA|mmetsp:Transcript_31745/g.92218  ORF Transcript_31745/g.92218 Transcript_31745/m.92218 type:complete len:297 (+) Transcript_31745:899-1789(+)